MHEKRTPGVFAPFSALRVNHSLGGETRTCVPGMDLGVCYSQVGDVLDVKRLPIEMGKCMSSAGVFVCPMTSHFVPPPFEPLASFFYLHRFFFVKRCYVLIREDGIVGEGTRFFWFDPPVLDMRGQAMAGVGALWTVRCAIALDSRKGRTKQTIATAATNNN